MRLLRLSPVVVFRGDRLKLHRHYKNKPYKVLGIAKHSETLEELVVYETLYENPTAKLWVRPRLMFDGNLMLEGREVARFAKIPLKIETFTEIGAEQERALSVLIKEIFGEWNSERIHSHLRNRTRMQVLIAWIDERPVAFKLGYELDEVCFCSSLEGVVPEYRGLGIARDLANAQHDWCRDQHYRKIKTKIESYQQAMLIHSIKLGFEIVGFDSPNITLEKTIGARP